MTLKSLLELVEKYGATIEIDIFADMTGCFQVGAPNEKQWVDGQCVYLTEEYYLCSLEDKQRAIDLISKRILQGLENYDPKINGEAE